MMSDLPANVRPVFDRHGKVRYRFRRKGWASAYVKGEPGSAEFLRSLAEIIEQGRAERPAVKSPRKAAPRSLDDLFARMKTGTRWQKKAATFAYYRASANRAVLADAAMSNVLSAFEAHDDQPLKPETPTPALVKGEG